MQGVTWVHTLLERAAKGRASRVSHLALTDVVFHKPTSRLIPQIWLPIHSFFFSLILLLFSCSVMSDFLWPHGLQHAIPCPSPSPGVFSDLCHWVDVIQPSHPLSPSSPPAFNLSQHQGLFQWVSFLHQVAKVLELQVQQRSFQWIVRVDFL